MIKRVNSEDAVRFMVGNISESIVFIRLVAAVGFTRSHCFADRIFVLVMTESKIAGKGFFIENPETEYGVNATIIFKGTISEIAKFLADVLDQKIEDTFHNGLVEAVL